MPLLIGLELLLTTAALMYLLYNLTSPGSLNTKDRNLYPLMSLGLLSVFVLISGLVSIAFSVLSWREYCKYGRVPRTLSANADYLSLSRLRFFRIRTRYWPVSEIRELRLDPIKYNLTRHCPSPVSFLFAKRNSQFASGLGLPTLRSTKPSRNNSPQNLVGRW